MRGPAQTFCYNRPVGVKHDYDELIDRLRERYDGQSMCEYGKWTQFKQAMSEFVYKFSARMESDYRRAGGMDQMMLVGCFIEGLLPVLKDKLMDRQPQCISDAVTIAKYYERNLNITAGFPVMAISDTPTVDALSSEDYGKDRDMVRKAEERSKSSAMHFPEARYAELAKTQNDMFEHMKKMGDRSDSGMANLQREIDGIRKLSIAVPSSGSSGRQFRPGSGRSPTDGDRRPRKHCNYCRRLGHLEDECYQKNGFPTDLQTR